MSRRIIRLPVVLTRTGYSKSTVRRKELAREFPRRVRLGQNSVGWFEDEVDEHVASRPREPLPGIKEQPLGVGDSP